MTNPNPAYKKNTLAGLSVPSSIQDPQLRRFLQSLKQHVELQHGNQGQPNERFVTLDDLARAGIASVRTVRGRGEIVNVAEVEKANTKAARVTVSSVSTDFPYQDTGAVANNGLRYEASSSTWVPSTLFDSAGNINTSILPAGIAYTTLGNTFTLEQAFSGGLTLANDTGINWFGTDNLKHELLKLDDTAADFYYDQTQILCDFDGADAATSYTEQSSNAASATFVGTAQLDTGQFKYGTAALLLDGNSDYVTFPDLAAYSLSNGDWTAEAHVRFATLPSGAAADMAIMGHWAETGNQRSWYIAINSSDKLELNWSIDGTAVQTLTSLNPITLMAGSWYHVAVVRSGGSVLVYLNGSQVTMDTSGGDDITGDTLHNSTDTFRVGAINAVAPLYLDGWIDNLRLTVGYARYTDNFSAPAEEFAAVSGSNIFNIGQTDINAAVLSPTLTIKDLEPAADDTHTLGTQSLRIGELWATTMRAFSGNATLNLPSPASEQHFLAALTDNAGSGTVSVDIDRSASVGPYPSFTIGAAAADAVATNAITVSNTGGGSVLIGTAGSRSSAAAVPVSLTNSGTGSVLIGLAENLVGGAGASVSMTSSQFGSVLIGAAQALGSTSASSMTSNGIGSSAIGACAALGASAATFSATGNGSVCMGYAYGGTLISSGTGCSLFGYAFSGGTLTNPGLGSFVGGYATGSGIVSVGAGAQGCIGYGSALAGQTISTGVGAINAIQFGIGTNSIDNSLQFGSLADMRATGEFRSKVDNVGHLFGAGGDASVYYDGTDLIIDPDLVGTGRVLIGATGDDDMSVNATYHVADSSGSYYGAGDDSHVYYDGTDLIIDPDLVGTGRVLIGATGDDNMSVNATYHVADSAGSYYGAGDDSHVYYDGTNLIIDPDLVGTGVVLIGATGDDDLRLNDIEVDGALNHDGTTVGLYGTVPVTQAAAITALTDSSGGTANNTVAAVSGSGDDATINDNFADLAAKVNAILAVIDSATGVGLTA